MITLRAGTYLSPSIPVEYYEMILQYLESKLGIHTTLLYESRWEGPRAEREDPFLSGYLDLAWMSSTVYLRMLKDSSPIELLPISSVHMHSRISDRPGYYSDVIMHKDLGEKVKDFIDLRGCKWAYNCPESLSGHVITLSKMKELGENASFYGNVLYSASVKSDIMKCLLNMHQDREGLKKLEEFHVRKFAPISPDAYDKEQFMIERTKDLKFGTTYY